jgi:demethylmenaquinone methyltransferase / 2-methoxy-6-polyprenyl-1,4-benzoquinol methylase
MKAGLTKETVRDIYNKTAHYYNLYHNLGTFGSDERGRNILIDKTVNENDYVLDAGGGTGVTAIKAGFKVGSNGKVVILDLSENMLEQARKKINELGMIKRFEIRLGDLYQILYPDETFDTVLSTYSTCPLENPINAVKEMLRVLKKGGLLGIAHSTDSDNKIAKWISNKIDNFIWKFPRLSLGCRNISLVDDIKKLDVQIIDEKIIGIIPFFFKILIIKKNGI